jgi:hypothetical protein
MQSEKNLSTRNHLDLNGLDPKVLDDTPSAATTPSSNDDDDNGRVQWFEKKLEALACNILISLLKIYTHVCQHKLYVEAWNM